MAAIAVTDPTVGVLVIKEHCTCNLAVAEIGKGEDRFIVTNVYASPNQDIAPVLPDISQILRQFRDRSILLAGDLNAKSPTWGRGQRDRRGVAVEAMFSEHNALIHNDQHEGPTLGCPTNFDFSKFGRDRAKK